MSQILLCQVRVGPPLPRNERASFFLVGEKSEEDGQLRHLTHPLFSLAFPFFFFSLLAMTGTLLFLARVRCIVAYGFGAIFPLVKLEIAR